MVVDKKILTVEEIVSLSVGCVDYEVFDGYLHL